MPIANNFDLLGVNEEDAPCHASVDICPPLDTAKVVRSQPPQIKKKQGPANADKEINKMAQDIEAAGIKVQVNSTVKACNLGEHGDEQKSPRPSVEVETPIEISIDSKVG